MKIIITTIVLFYSGLLWAAGGGPTYPNDKAPVNVANEASLQRGAKLYVNYCLGCHSMKYQRYNRLARDLQLSEDLVKENLMFTAGLKVGDTMVTTMPEQQAKDWFGAKPPDLSLIARSRGVDWLYNYLRGFYRDDDRPYGVNNSVFPMVGMPHVLWDLQGIQEPLYDAGKVIGFTIPDDAKGALTPEEFDGAMADLVNFLSYVGEPMQLERKRLGFWVILYLLLALVVFYLLKREYWRDVH